MTAHFVNHDSFSLDRTYNAAPTRVYAAWSDPAAKANWFPKADQFEFRVGGLEVVSATEGGILYKSTATFQEIVPEHRIVYTVNLDVDNVRASVSVVTVEFKPEGTGTRLLYTEQCTFLDGKDSKEAHVHGAEALLDMLDAELKRTN